MNTTQRCSGSRSAAALAAGLALAAVLTGCGSDGGDDTASDPAGSSPTGPTNTPTKTPPVPPTDTDPPEPGGAEALAATGSAGITQASMVSATEGGGSASPMAFALDTDQALSDFVAPLEAGLPDAVTAAVAQVAQQSPDATPYGAVVSLGCEAPRSVAIEAGEAGFQVVPQLPKNTVQCVAPVTYVVLFAAPDA